MESAAGGEEVLDGYGGWYRRTDHFLDFHMVLIKRPEVFIAILVASSPSSSAPG